MKEIRPKEHQNIKITMRIVLTTLFSNILTTDEKDKFLGTYKPPKLTQEKQIIYIVLYLLT